MRSLRLGRPARQRARARTPILRNRSLASLTAAKFVSSLGSWMSYVALSWFVLVTTGSTAKMSFVLGAQVLAAALLGVPSGEVVARLGVRRTMLVSDLARAALVALIPLLHELDVLTFPLLLALAFAIGMFSAPYYSSQRLILPELLGDDEQAISQANSVVDGAVRATTLLGPLVAGLLIGWLGAANVLWLDATSFLLSFAILALFVHVRKEHVPVPDVEAKSILAGIRFLARDRLLRGMAAAILIFGLVFPILMASLPVLAFTRYGGDARIAGFLVGAWGGGTLAGSVLAFKAVERFELLPLAAAAEVCAMVPLWLLVLSLPAVGVAAILFLSGLFLPLVNAPMTSMLTTRTPSALRPKVMTAMVTADSLAGPLGYAAAGPALQLLGIRSTFAIVAGGASFAALAFLATARGAGDQRSRQDEPSPSPFPREATRSR